MKIAIFTRSTIDHFKSGGMETHLLNLSEGLVSNEHQVDIITTSYPNRKEIEKRTIDIERNGVKYYFLGNTTPGLRTITRYENLLKKIGIYKRNEVGEGKNDYYKESLQLFNELNTKNNYDLIISQSSMAYGIYKNINTPIISVIHGTITGEIKNRFKANRTIKNWIRYFIVDLPNWIIELYSKNNDFYKSISCVIAVSDTLAKEFKNEKKYNNRLEIIYNGVDSEKFKPVKKSKKTGDKKFTILNIGRMDREKGIDILIDVVHLLVKRGLDLKLKLVGSGYHINEFKSQVSEFKLLDKVEFVGEISNDKISNYYNEADIFALFTRRNEGHPMVVSEALCSGLPILAAKKGGLADTILDGYSGYLFDDLIIEKLAERIEKLYYDDDLLKELSNNARKSGLENYSKKAMIEKYELVFQSCI